MWKTRTYRWGSNKNDWFFLARKIFLQALVSAMICTVVRVTILSARRTPVAFHVTSWTDSHSHWNQSFPKSNWRSQQNKPWIPIQQKKKEIKLFSMRGRTHLPRTHLFTCCCPKNFCAAELTKLRLPRVFRSSLWGSNPKKAKSTVWTLDGSWI